MKRHISIVLLALGVLPALAQEIHEVTPLELGPLAEDYAPVLLDGGFVMCSVRETESSISFKDAESGKPLTDLYWVPLNGEIPGTPIIFSANLATPVNEGPSSFAENGSLICYTRNQTLPKRLSNLRASNSQLGLYFSRSEQNVWSAPEAFEHNSPKYSTMHPALTKDGMTLYFASDAPGGLGGVDLYMCTRTIEGWSLPLNLGPQVNSTGNDMFPTLGPDGTMYFPSDRVGGMGRLDVYSVEAGLRGWGIVTHLPAPINSTGNDLGMAYRDDGRSGLFSTDRTGVDRIFAFKRTVPKFRNCVPQQTNNYCYSFKAKQHAAMTSLPLDHVWDLGDGTRVSELRVDHCYAHPGTYKIQSLLVDRKTGTTFFILKSHELVIEDIPQAWISAPDTVRTGRTLALDANRSHLPNLTAGEFHWNMGNGVLLSGPRTQYTYRTAGTYEVKLDVLSVPDERGVITNQCNTRTIIVMDKFRDHEDMAMVATYQDALGKTHSFEFQELPFDMLGLTTEDMADAVFAVELFASKTRVNLDDPRFIEVLKFYRVVERFDPIRAVYTYSVGETNDMDELYKIFKKVKELQFMDAEVHQLQVEKLMDLSQLDLSTLDQLNNSKLRTNAIHFEYKSAEIGDGSEPVLERIVGLLRQHPELKLVIEAHTDDIGGKTYNYELSDSRAQSVQKYFEANGVAPERMVSIGHGKNQPIASNKSEEGRQQNRRVEFRMTVKGQEQAFQKTR